MRSDRRDVTSNHSTPRAWACCGAALLLLTAGCDAPSAPNRDASGDASAIADAIPDASSVDASGPDPCEGVVCTTPPADSCVNAMVQRAWDPQGTCALGECSYASADIACLDGCDAGQCHPTWGWDFNLHHRCMTSPMPTEANYYEDLTDCPVADKHWTLAVQSEQSLGQSCIGPNTQSHLINGTSSPVTAYWQPHVDELGRPNWTVDIKTDFMTNIDPCGGGTYTWFSLMDHVYHGGGPFPTAANVVFHATVTYDDWTPNGASRAIAMWGGEWDGKGIMVEIDLQSQNWDDAYPGVPDIIQVVNNATLQWVSMAGDAMGLSIPRQVATTINIPWHSIIADLITRGFLVGPVSGDLNTVPTTSLSLATEVKNNSSTGAVAEMWISDFRALHK